MRGLARLGRLIATALLLRAGSWLLAAAYHTNPDRPGPPARPREAR